ncbi:DNA-binding protein [Candidatus Bathyarchaeota archaeon]|nr:DNA-binding protein [Candidatus Bathyarchaeota archaeon]
MKSRYVVKDSRQGRVFVARLKPEADLILSIRKIAEEKSVKSGVILSGVGLLRKAELRNCKSLPEKYPITDVNRMFTTIEKPLEILAVSGIIYTVKGEPNVHAHAVLSFIEDGRISVLGGHLLEGCLVYGFG